MAELSTLPLTLDDLSHSGRCADSHQICQQKCGGVFLAAGLLSVTKSARTNGQGNSPGRFTDYQPNLAADLFPLQFQCQITCLNVILLYFSPFKYMYTVPNAKSVLFTQISNSYLVCCNKLKFPSKN